MSVFYLSSLLSYLCLLSVTSSTVSVRLISVRLLSVRLLSVSLLSVPFLSVRLLSVKYNVCHSTRTVCCNSYFILFISVSVVCLFKIYLLYILSTIRRLLSLPFLSIALPIPSADTYAQAVCTIALILNKILNGLYAIAA